MLDTSLVTLVLMAGIHSQVSSDTTETHQLHMLQLEEGTKRLGDTYGFYSQPCGAQLATALEVNAVEEAARMAELHVIENTIDIKCPRCTQVSQSNQVSL